MSPVVHVAEAGSTPKLSHPARYFVNTLAIAWLDGSTITSLCSTIAKSYGRSEELLAVTLLGIGLILGGVRHQGANRGIKVCSLLIGRLLAQVVPRDLSLRVSG